MVADKILQEINGKKGRQSRDRRKREGALPGTQDAPAAVTGSLRRGGGQRRPTPGLGLMESARHL